MPLYVYLYDYSQNIIVAQIYKHITPLIMYIFQKKENDTSGEKIPFEQTIENIKKECEKLISENKAKDEEILNLKSTIEKLIAQQAPQETPAPEQQPIAEEPKQEVPVAASIDYTPALDTINASIMELSAKTEELKVLLNRRDTQDENVKAMHKELEKFRGDFYAKITQPYLMAMLDLHKRFFETHAHFDHLDNSEADMAQLYNNLMIEFKSAVDALENRIYNDFGVEYYMPNVGDEFNPKAHQAFEVTVTNDAELHRKVAKVIYGGFRDIDSEKILRPARISCYKLENE